MSVKSNKKCKVITLDMKLDNIKWSDNGQSKASISRALGLNKSTVRPILSKSDEYIKQGKVPSASFSIQCTRNRSSVLVEMEYLFNNLAGRLQLKADANWYQ